MLKDLRPNPNLYPPGGFAAVLADGRFEGTSWADLVEKVRRFRLSNRFPKGDPEQEVYDYFCKKYPHYCNTTAVEAAPVTAKSHKHQERTFSNQVLSWISSMFSKTFMRTVPLVESKEEAARRAEICNSCHEQKARIEDCISCGGNYKSLVEGIKKRVPHCHNELLCCRLLAEDTAISVALTQSPSANRELPEFCWRRRV